MESVENGKSALISSIRKDARIEADNLLAEAEKQAEERKRYVEKQAQSILKEAEGKAAEQAEAIKRNFLSGIDIEVKRQAMRIRDTMLNDIMNRTEEELHELVQKTKYRTILQNWVIEAAIGLGVEFAEVNASKDELHFITKKFLLEAEKKVKTIQGRAVRLKLSDKPALRLQGVTLTAEDGRTAFNNQVKTRILRNQRKIRKRIYDNLFTED